MGLQGLTSERERERESERERASKPTPVIQLLGFASCTRIPGVIPNHSPKTI